ncbi:MAG: rhomboid family intramembrane serine protease [Oscillospiraceae bacterium]|nr:rhomboid family intramembrane serine protease [Oscillospiraceae bacterium]
MKNLRNRFERFCFKHRSKGIPNLMLYVSLASALVYFISMFAQNYTLYYLLRFDRALILQGQVWRLITFPFVYAIGDINVLLVIVSLFCYYSLGRAMENTWGTFRFNLFYFSGIVLMDVYCLLFGGYADVYYLNLSLFLAYATMYPNSQFLLFFIIPVKAWIFALIDLAITAYEVISMSIPVFYFPHNLFPLVAIANYLLFFGKDVANVIPLSWRINFRRLFNKKSPKAQPKAKTIPFPSAGSYEATVAKPKAPYTHRCTVCGRTDISHPDLEFRYCSRCNGYHCYCIDHINDHTHVE